MNPRRLRRLGIDLDNTIVDYSALIREEMASLGIAEPLAGVDKRLARDALRSLPEGELHWTRLQARIYGIRMGNAVPFPGALECIARARAAGIELAIVSHKTEFAAAAVAEGRPNLWDAAREWLAAHRVVGPQGVPPGAVFFESTRAEKTARIAALELDAFLDDLLEVFIDPGFPAGVKRWLFAPEAPAGDLPVDRAFPSWDAIARAIFENGKEAHGTIGPDSNEPKHGR